jgi:pimeloyl-ACP methyl ester carboxylesterase
MGYRHVTLSDGTRLNTFDNERDAPAVLFIHGNSCDHTFLSPQIEHFAPTRRVIAPDLRGHGESDKPEDGYSFVSLSADLAELLALRNAVPAVAVGHSMGGLLALELAWRHPGLVTAIACLDSTLFTPPGRPSRVHALLDGLKSSQWRSYFVRYFESSFDVHDDPARRQAILERMLMTPQHVVSSLFEHWRIADGQAALRAWQGPLLYVASSRPRPDVALLKDACPTAMTGQVAGAGHFLTLEAPEQVNAMLERFLAVYGV